MREILFRGKRVVDDDWVYGYYYKAKLHAVDSELCDFITIPHPEEEGRRSDHYMVYSETVGQYTGLTDKNGRKIFEGDILEFSDRVVVVFWHAHLGCWDSKFLKFTNKENDRDDMSPVRWCYKSKVIGNIHDNSELLKGGEG